jgi:hypothetical protein
MEGWGGGEAQGVADQKTKKTIIFYELLNVILVYPKQFYINAINTVWNFLPR